MPDDCLQRICITYPCHNWFWLRDVGEEDFRGLIKQKVLEIYPCERRDWEGMIGYTIFTAGWHGEPEP